MTDRADISHFFTKIVSAHEGERQDPVPKLWPGDPLRVECQPGEAGGQTVVNVLDAAGRVLGHLRPNRAEEVTASVAQGHLCYVFVTDVTGSAPGEASELNVMVILAEPSVDAQEAKRYAMEDRRRRRDMALAAASDEGGGGDPDAKWRALGMAVLIVVVAMILVAWLYS